MIMVKDPRNKVFGVDWGEIGVIGGGLWDPFPWIGMVGVVARLVG